MKVIDSIVLILIDLATGFVGLIFGYELTVWIAETYLSLTIHDYTKGNGGEIVLIPFCILGGVGFGILLVVLVHKSIKRARAKDSR